MLDSLVASVGIESTVHKRLSADAIRTFKPATELYEYAAAELETAPERIAHVTAHWMDVQGAQTAGMQGVWLNRPDDAWTAFGEAPDLVVDSVAAFVDRLSA